ncbi:WXG100 family type VII secretion target [Isoptericola sp. F-RaC21]|uniref:WXG100 family type VII secretion target n=1 Tax=Isoptericola sp. F-RaC21 TaxID=3141452 RepID=UPI00315C0265
MAGYLGLNPEEMQQLVQVLRKKADKIEELVGKLNQQVKATTWDGPDAERFKSEWESKHQTALKQVATALEQISQAAKKELDQQKATSH